MKKILLGGLLFMSCSMILHPQKVILSSSKIEIKKGFYKKIENVRVKKIGFYRTYLVLSDFEKHPFYFEKSRTKIDPRLLKVDVIVKVFFEGKELLSSSTEWMGSQEDERIAIGYFEISQKYLLDELIDIEIYINSEDSLMIEKFGRSHLIEFVTGGRK